MYKNKSYIILRKLSYGSYTIWQKNVFSDPKFLFEVYFQQKLSSYILTGEILSKKHTKDWGNILYETTRRGFDLNSLWHHSKSVTVLISFLLKEHVIDEETCSNESSLAANIQIHGKPDKVFFLNNWKFGDIIRNSKVVHISKCLLEESCPLFWDPSNLMFTIRCHNLEFYISCTRESAPWTLND